MQAKPRFVNWARIEDWALVAWMAFATPVFARIQGTTGPFDPGRPIDGVLGIAAVAGAFACLVTTSSDRPPEDGPGILERASIGPLVGGLLLVATSAFAGLSLPDLGSKLVVVGAAIGIVAVRIRWPKLPTTVRRALVAPFTLVAGNLFGTLIHQLTGGAAFSGPVTATELGGLAVLLGFCVVFAAVFYAMLVYAPRQIAEPEGGPATWIRRFALFVAGTMFGLGWLGILGA